MSNIREQAYTLANELNQDGGNLVKSLPTLRRYFSKENFEIEHLENLVEFLNDGLGTFFSRFRLRAKWVPLFEGSDHQVVELTTFAHRHPEDTEIDTVTVDPNIKG